MSTSVTLIGAAVIVAILAISCDVSDVKMMILSPPTDTNHRFVEHILTQLILLKCLFVLWGLAQLGPAKAWKRVVGGIFSSLQGMPGFEGLVDKGIEKELIQIRKDLLGDGDVDALHSIPKTGLSQKDIVTKLKAAKGLSKALGEGQGLKAWGGVYHTDGSTLTKVQNEAWALFNCSNTLYPGTFPGVRKFEAELISMTLGIVHGHECGAVGLMTSGGTESILVAVLAYRNAYRQKFGFGGGGSEKDSAVLDAADSLPAPEVICGVSAHPALTKACHYFGVKLVKVQLDPKTMAMDPATVEAAITKSTVCVYASAPTFTHGVVDPIQALGSLCSKKGIGLHVDNCLGGFLLSYLQKQGLLKDGALFDFQVKGVTSMSVDVHKYGNASKGCSVVCFREKDLRRASYVPSVDGCEGLYVTPTLQGSRSGGNIAQAWATLLSVGEEGYLEMAASTAKLTQAVVDAVGKIPELELLVQPHAAIIPIVAKKGSGVEIYQVASVLETKGWNMFTGQNPPVMSVCLGEQHTLLLDDWVNDLEASVAYVKANPGLKLEGQCAVYGAAAAIPDALLDSVLRSYCDIRMEVKDKA